jgi:cupin 2 domain-containing protein
MPPPNLLADLPTSLPDELVQTLLTTPHVRIERIISHGHCSPDDSWYDQEQNEWVLLIAGAARLQFENEAVEMTPGSYVTIVAHRRHRVQWTSTSEPTIWLAIHYG